MKPHQHSDVSVQVGESLRNHTYTHTYVQAYIYYMAAYNTYICTTNTFYLCKRKGQKPMKPVISLGLASSVRAFISTGAALYSNYLRHFSLFRRPEKYLTANGVTQARNLTTLYYSKK
ncbi:putative immunity protein PlnM [Trichinella spiralis]|uniref:putative immunity protein PlnM n=1 Tax=Trichinella spiralis TaxID=6334 RepID=UPI0001EFBB5C|nr:putative immunity protein PlnM [Trichinella spiralis]